MNSSIFDYIISQLPVSVGLTIILFFLLLFTGYVASIVAGFRSERGEGLRGLLLFPVTNPFALVVFCTRDWKAARFALVCYLGTVVTLPLGGAVAQRVEMNRLASYERELEEEGEDLGVAQYIPAPVPAEQNVWEHPFLKPIAEASRRNADGEVVFDSSTYDALAIPYGNLRYVEYVSDQDSTKKQRDVPRMEAFLPFHRTALSTKPGEALLAAGKAPESWDDCGHLILNHYEPVAGDFLRLGEALSRPVDRYPYAWDEGFNLLMPNLARAKAFTQATTSRCEAYAATGQSSEALADLQLALTLIHTGQCDLLISRLVQWAQTTITLNPILFAQQCHLWTEAEWTEIQQFLMALNAPAQVPASLRCERVLGHQTLQPMLDLGAIEIRTTLDQMGSYDPDFASSKSVLEQGFERVTDFFIGGLARAFLTSQWRLCLEAYQVLIEATEAEVEESSSTPWKDLVVTDLPMAHDEYGILAGMLLPAMQKAFSKSIDVQTLVEVAIVGCALERYFLMHGEYPDLLDELVPEFLSEPPLDPMTREPWRYEREGTRGFQLYSVGRNGIDDGGLRTVGMLQKEESRRDDLAWIITEEMPPLPGFVYEPPGPQTQGSVGVDKNSVYYEKMLKRYGLSPVQ